jgi:hypothetical protein
VSDARPTTELHRFKTNEALRHGALILYWQPLQAITSPVAVGDLSREDVVNRSVAVMDSFDHVERGRVRPRAGGAVVVVITVIPSPPRGGR